MSASCHGMVIEKFINNAESNSLFNVNYEEYYDYEEPLPQGPTPPSSGSSNKQSPVRFPGLLNIFQQ